MVIIVVCLALASFVASARADEEEFETPYDRFVEDSFGKGFNSRGDRWQGKRPFLFREDDEILKAVGSYFSKPVGLSGILMIVPPTEDGSEEAHPEKDIPSFGLFFGIDGNKKLYLTQRYHFESRPERTIFRRDVLTRLGSFSTTLIAEERWHDRLDGLSQIGFAIRSRPAFAIPKLGVTVTSHLNAGYDFDHGGFVGFVRFTFSRSSRSPRP